MSCIPKILGLKGNKEFLPVPNKGTVIEDGGNYRGHDWLITFSNRGFRCAYVALPCDHLLNDKKFKDIYDIGIDIHGGVTFFKENHISKEFFGENACSDIWVGFDANHLWDLTDIESLKKYFPDLSPSLLEHVKNRADINRSGDEPGFKLRTKSYMQQECKNLIDQLIGMNNETKEEDNSYC